MTIPYAPEITAIIQRGLDGHPERVRAYTELLLQKVERDGLGDTRFAKMLRDFVSGEYKKWRKVELKRGFVKREE